MSWGRARCFSWPAGAQAVYCTLSCHADAGCAQGSCEAESGMCAPTCAAGSDCPDGWNCTAGESIPNGVDGGIAKDAGSEIDAGDISDGGIPDAGAIPKADVGRTNDPPKDDAGSSTNDGVVPTNFCGGCATNGSDEWTGYGLAVGQP